MKVSGKLFWVLALLLSPVAGASSFCQKTLTLAYNDAWPPYVDVNAEGQGIGTDFQLLDKILQQLGCRLKIVKVPAKRLLLDIEKGSSDIALAVSKTKKREERFLYSAAYRNEIITLVYDAKYSDLQDYATLFEIVESKHIVALNLSAWYGTEVEEVKGNIIGRQLIHIDNTAERILMMDKKRVEAVIDDGMAVCSLLSDSQRKRFKYHSHILNTGEVYFIFNKDVVSQEFLQQFNSVLQQMKKSGELLNIIQQNIDPHCDNFIRQFAGS
jgi:polar amino acid transport system substrate-binding protein